MFLKNLVGRFRKFATQFLQITGRQKLRAMLFKEAPQNIVQEFARIDGLEIECRFSAGFNLQHPIGEKSEFAISVITQTAGAVNVARPEMSRQHLSQIGVRYFTVKWSEPLAVAVLFDLHASSCRSRNQPVTFGALYQFVSARVTIVSGENR